MDNQKLDPEFKAKWIAALRSGEYKQGKDEMLNESGEMCCLAVAAHVCGVSKDNIRGHKYPSGLLPADRFKMPLFFQNCRPDDGPWRLAVMNDIENKSFSEIADYIEKNL